MSADQTYVRGILRVVTRGGTITELMFTEMAGAQAAEQAMWRSVDSMTAVAPVRVMDDFGHSMTVRPDELAMTVAVDLRSEVDGAVAKAWETQKGQDRHNERMRQRNTLMGGQLLPGARPLNGAPVLGSR